MAQTLTRLLIHVVFSTKRREAHIAESWEKALFAYIGGICRAHESALVDAGAADDHVHLLIALSKNHALSPLLMHVKKDSSKWAKAHSARLAWQDGYAAFSVGASQLPALKSYFAKQRVRHRRSSFQDELRALCKRYDVTLDEALAWT